MPDLSGRTEQEARDLLAKARLRVGEVTQAESGIKPGTVLKQDHAPGSQAAVGTPVGFAIAIPRRGLEVFTPRGGRGGGLVQTPPTTVPDLSGLTEQEARDLLAKARLRVGDITKAEAGIKPGTVLKQDHAPGSQAAVGTPVGFAIAIPITVIVPDVVGYSERDASATLNKARLRTGAVRSEPSRSPSGRVLAQGLKAGGRFPVGSAVDLVIASPIDVAVPQLVGRAQREAIDVLKGAELAAGAVRFEESRRPVGTVLWQQPLAGAIVAIGSAVDIATATPVTVAVPPLVGRTQAEAMGLLKNLELVAGDVGQEEARRPPGTVFSQQPAAGTRVAIGSAVDITTATPVTVAVPPLVGRTQADAVGSLKGAELVLGAATSEESRRPAGAVLSQQPAAGTRVVIGSRVDIVTATPVTVDVPPLVGRPYTEATGLLKRAELVAGATLEESRRPAGTVLSQQPAAGTRVVIGSTVDFVTATPVTVLAPQLTGRTQPEAIGLLRGAELELGAARQEESRRPAGTVLSQQPAAGTRVAIGTTVDIATATPVTVAVPPLVGRTQAEAMGLLKNLELVAGDVGSEEARRPPGTVLSQQPAAGTRVVIGTAVAIVAARPVTVLVPDVVSRSEADARQVLTNGELVAGTVSAEESRRPPGSVLRQSVTTGTRVTIGTAVDLVTATPVTVLVPGLVGRSEDSARQRLADLELGAGTIQYQESADVRRTVLAQSINPDTRAALGTLVNLVVAVAETVAVPSVAGLPVEQARRILLDGRLGVGDEQRRGTNVEPPGTVLAQNNVSGTRVAVGTPIVLTVAMPPVVTVPSVVGMQHDEAAARITAEGLEVGPVARRFSLRAGGTVLAQTAAAGEQVQFGAPVALDEAQPRVVWLMPVAGLLFLAGLTGLVKARKKLPDSRSHPAREKSSERTPPIDFAVRANVDAGDAHVQSDAVPAVRREVRIQPVADGGSQDLSAAAGDLVRGERRERKHDAPPREEAP